jgi:hypothetical protein
MQFFTFKIPSKSLYLPCLLPCLLRCLIALFALSASSMLHAQQATSSPILEPSTSTVPLATVSSQAYRPSKQLYPVTIISINSWPVEAKQQSVALAPGEYLIELVPNFSVLSEQRVFMNQSFAGKKVKLQLNENQTVMLGARIMDLKTQEWQVQFLDVSLP